VPGPEQTVEATILGVVPDGNGWTKIQTDQGDFTTKWPEPVAEAQQHQGQRVVIAFENGEARQSQRTGQWFPAPRYFKRVQSPGYQPPQAMQPQPAMQQPQPMMQPQPQHGPDERSMQIMRQAAAKCAVWTMPLVPSEQRTFQNQLAVAEAWLRYFIGGVQATGTSPAPLTQEQQMVLAHQMGGFGGGPQPDDDIPF